ncbi:MAG: glycosyltransferase [Planctomycetes bacterium]|nr:glycosyltransferase [Planctomycetota bacterium]
MNTATLADPRPPLSARRPLHVVIVDEELPYPPTSGKRIRTLNLTRRLADRHRLTYLCHRNADPREAEEARTHFAELGIETVVVERVVPPKSGPRFYARLAANLLSRLPYSVASHNSRALRRAIRTYAASHHVDLWHCEWTPYAEPLRCLPGGRRLVMAHNVESLIWQRYFENETQPLKRWYIRRQWRKFRRFETRALREADLTIAVSPEDASLFRRDFGVETVDVVDNGVDTEYFRPSPGPRDPDRILFLGSLDWRPNLDAVNQLLEHLHPAVRRDRPSATFCIVGRNPPPALRRRTESLPGVELHADVGDVRPFLAGSAVMVVPLRIGGGSRLKILEALATGLPVVSTRVGAEGLALEDGRHLTVRETVPELAGALLECLGHPAPALARAEEGRRRVLERYDWDILADRLERIWLDCAH